MPRGTFSHPDQPYFFSWRQRVVFWLRPMHWFYAGLVFVVSGLAYLPYPWQVKIGEGLGRICYATGRKYRYIVDKNLRLCFPALEDAARYQLLKAYFRSAGIGAMEVIMAFWAPKRRTQGLLQIEGYAHLQQAYATGKGVILLSAHFTMLEICMRLSCENIDVPLHLVYRQQKNAFFNYLWIQKRRRFVDKLIAHDDIRSMFRSLKRGNILCYVPDQDFGQKYEHVFAPFFGVPAATITSTSRLAKITGSSVMLVTYVRLPDAQGYKVVFHPPLSAFPTENMIADASTLNREFEHAIRENPAQYFWHHRRFKTRPAGEGRMYERIRRKYI